MFPTFFLIFGWERIGAHPAGVRSFSLDASPLEVADALDVAEALERGESPKPQGALGQRESPKRAQAEQMGSENVR